MRDFCHEAPSFLHGSHAVSLSADIESRTRETKKNSETGGYFTNSFQLPCTMIFHTFLCREEMCDDVDVLL